MSTLISGIIQSDIILQSAIRLGLKEFRDNPDLIDDVFAGLVQDSVSQDKYGDTTIQQCKKWFANSKVVVKLGLSIDVAHLPCVAIGMGPSNEGEATFADLHYEVSEADPRTPSQYRQLQSVCANESHSIGTFVHGEPEYALFLQSLVLFQLLRRKEDLLEARGFELSGFQVGALEQVDIETGQNVFSRGLQLSGKIRHSWPSIHVGAEITDVVANLPSVEVVGTENEIERIADLAALMDQDMLLGMKPKV